MNTLERKSIPIQIILTIFTCGFYGIYWLYCIIRDINIVSGDPNSMSPVVVILLSFVTCNIYPSSVEVLGKFRKYTFLSALLYFVKSK